jgi:hypothetical protein
MKRLFTLYIDAETLAEARAKADRTGRSLAYLINLGLRYVIARVPDEKLRK